MDASFFFSFFFFAYSCLLRSFYVYVMYLNNHTNTHAHMAFSSYAKSTWWVECISKYCIVFLLSFCHNLWGCVVMCSPGCMCCLIVFISFVFIKSMLIMVYSVDIIPATVLTLKSALDLHDFAFNVCLLLSLVSFFIFIYFAKTKLRSLLYFPSHSYFSAAYVVWMWLFSYYGTVHWLYTHFLKYEDEINQRFSSHYLFFAV